MEPLLTSVPVLLRQCKERVLLEACVLVLRVNSHVLDSAMTVFVYMGGLCVCVLFMA